MANRKPVDFYLYVVLSFSLFVNVGLAMKVHRLNLIVAPVPTNRLAVGSIVGALDGFDVSGKARHLHFPSGRKSVVLYTFTPTCTWCAKNLDNIKQIYRLKHLEFEFVGVSLSPDGIPEYLSQSGLPLEVLKSPSSETRQSLHLNVTPTTIVIDNSGVVKQVWTGAYTEKMCREIEAFLKITAGTLKPVS